MLNCMFFVMHTLLDLSPFCHLNFSKTKVFLLPVAFQFQPRTVCNKLDVNVFEAPVRLSRRARLIAKPAESVPKLCTTTHSTQTGTS